MQLDIKSFVWGLAVGVILMLVVCGAVLLGTAAVMVKRQAKVSAPESDSLSAFCPLAGDEGVTSLLRPIRQKFGVPAIAAVVVTSESIQLVGSVGVRKRETKIPVTLNEQWHLGSDGKAMTSTLIGRLVERGRLKWHTTLADVFP